MQHLKYLSIVDYIFAACGLLGSLLFGGLGLLLLGLGAMNDALMSSLPQSIGMLVFALVGGGMSIALIFVGRGVARGRSRTAQTILALPGLCSGPFGWGFLGYTAWVCYMNEETKQVFEEGGLLD